MKYTRDFYEKLIGAAYEGLTSEGIRYKLNITENSLSYHFRVMGLKLSTVRLAKRKGNTLSGVIGGVDWSFLNTRDASLSERAKRAAVRRSAKGSDEMQELLRLVREIHAVWCGQPSTPPKFSWTGKPGTNVASA